MGKSTAAAALRRGRIPVFDSDAAVHALQAPNGAALAAIATAFPGTVTRDGSGRAVLDRSRLRHAAFGDSVALATLEAIMHPLVRRMEHAFLATWRRRGKRLVALDVPLLFESRGTAGIDLVVVVSAPAAVQRARARARGALSETQLNAVLARQWPDEKRRRAAGRVVQTGLSRHHAHIALRRIIDEMQTL